MRMKRMEGEEPSGELEAESGELIRRIGNEEGIVCLLWSCPGAVSARATRKEEEPGHCL